MINNFDFKEIIENDEKNYIILDARENLEYENGNLPGSLHIRFADLRAGKWIDVPGDKNIIVLCWSGIRGKEVAEFLRTKKIVASYLEDGAKGWYDFGGEWSGNIMFADKYNEEKYRIVYDTEEEGAVLVDCREPYKYNQDHIVGSFNIPIMHTSSVEFVKVFSQVPSGAKVITVCDSYVNCFDAKITGVELQNRCYEFLGRYNRPWEY